MYSLNETSLPVEILFHPDGETFSTANAPDRLICFAHQIRGLSLFAPPSLHPHSTLLRPYDDVQTMCMQIYALTRIRLVRRVVLSFSLSLSRRPLSVSLSISHVYVYRYYTRAHSRVPSLSLSCTYVLCRQGIAFNKVTWMQIYINK